MYNPKTNLCELNPKNLRESNVYSPSIAIFIIILLVISASVTFASSMDNLRLITAEPYSTDNRGKQILVEVLKLSNTGLEAILTLGDDSLGGFFVNCYYRENVIIIGLGKTRLREIRAISMQSPWKSTSIERASSDRLTNAQLRVNDDNIIIAEVSYFDRSVSSKNRTVVKTLSGEKTSPISTLANTELRLTGCQPTGRGLSDIVKIRFDNEGNIIPHRPGVSLQIPDLPIVPQQFIETYIDRTWNVIALTTAHIAFLSTPTIQTDSSLPLIIFDRMAQEYKNYSIPGGETDLRLINNWLVGSIAFANIKSNYEAGYSLPEVRNGSVLLLNVTNDQSIVQELGMDSEVLWIDENGVVIYRVGDRLMQAVIEDDKLSNSIELLSDPMVKHIHWAFRGGEGE